MSARVGLAKYAVALVALLVATAPVVDAAPSKDAKASTASQGGGGLEIELGLGEEQTVSGKTPDRLAFEKAQSQMAADDYKNAAVTFHELLQKKEAAELHEQSEYLLAKALYRLGFYHSALNRFVSILSKGEKHKYFKTSKEWLFFISRKSADQGVVAEEIARYTGDNLPEKYADEFHFILAKLYFRKAVDAELLQQNEEEGEEPAKQEEPAPAKQKPADEDMDFGSDALGGGGDAPGIHAGSPGDDMDFDMDDLGGKPKKAKKSPPAKKAAPPPAKVERPKPAAKPAEPPPEKAKATPKPAPVDDGMDFGAGDENKPLPKGTETTPVADKPKAPESPKLVTDKDEALGKCADHAGNIKATSPLYLRATYLKAVCLYEQQQFEKAVVAFREVVRLTHPKHGKFKNPAMREQAFFSLARTHYSFQQFRAAIFYYDRISRDSPAWLDALFESSWAYFRLGDYEKALGNLVTLHSPFFANEYFPESHILKAVTYYENCRYPEALAILDEFEARYGPLRDELDKLTKDAKTSEDYYKLLKGLEKRTDATALTARLSRLARTDKNLELMAASAKELEAEEQRILAAPPPLSGSPLVAQMMEQVRKRKQELATTAGDIARAKLEGERDELKSLSGQLFRIKFEITKREKTELEASLRGEKQTTKLGRYRFSAAVSDEHNYWPFDGEYWRDELGTYEYTLAKGCRQ